MHVMALTVAAVDFGGSNKSPEVRPVRRMRSKNSDAGVLWQHGVFQEALFTQKEIAHVTSYNSP